MQCSVFSFQLSNVVPSAQWLVNLRFALWIILPLLLLLLYFAHQKYKSIGIVNANSFSFICFLQQRCSAAVLCFHINENVFPMYNINYTIAAYSIHDDCTVVHSVHFCKFTFDDSRFYYIIMLWCSFHHSEFRINAIPSLNICIHLTVSLSLLLSQI